VAVSPGTWREVAWNGIRFETPRSWEPARVGSRYLLFEDDARPVMEVKWGKVTGRFSHAAQLKRLSTGKGRKQRPAVTPSDLPPPWAAALNAFEGEGFSWRAEGMQARGAILYCPTCRQAAMIQFFGLGSGVRREDPPRVLASYRDHADREWAAWSLFDIRALIPDSFRLLRHRFAAGYFELAFGGGGRKICLHRWAPARVLLGRTGLEGFARQRIGFPEGEPVMGAWGGHPVVEWVVGPAPGRGARWWARFKSRTPYKWLRLWHLEGENRILAVRAESRRPTDTGLLDDVCAAYEVV